MANSTTFGKLENGAKFYTATGEYVKINAFASKRTDAAWANSENIARLSYDAVVVEIV